MQNNALGFWLVKRMQRTCAKGAYCEFSLDVTRFLNFYWSIKQATYEEGKISVDEVAKQGALDSRSRIFSA